MLDINPNFSTQRQIMRQNLKLVPTNIEGIMAVEAPPPGFDPRKANLSDLMKYGIPARPDPARFPKGAAIWDRILSRTHQIIVPALRIRPEVKKSLYQPPSSGKATNTSGNWSGGVLLGGGPFDFVYGEWTVPGVSPPGWPNSSQGDGDWWSVAWVGIDGWNSGDVLQAGTGQHASLKNWVLTTEYFAWFEWYPNSWIEITNFPIRPGDTVAVSVQYMGVQNNLGQGLATLSNLITGQSLSIAFSAPSGTTLQGNCAEWILERPTMNGSLANLPEYGQVAFTNGLACSATGGTDASQAQAFTMTDNTGNTLSTGSPGGTDWNCTYV